MSARASPKRLIAGAASWLCLVIESEFTQAVHRALRKHGIYCWKISDRFRAGVPDAWYSGPGGDLWIEYKYLQRQPRRWYVPKLSELQIAWLNDRHSEGRRVAVVVGCPDGAQWLDPPFEGKPVWPHFVPRKDLITRIVELVAPVRVS